MFNIFGFFSRFPIFTQILIGFCPVFFALVFLAVANNNNLNFFVENFSDFSQFNEKRLAFQEIEKDTVELQRNILVYSYIGYTGVLKNIDFIQQNLEAKFDSISPWTQQDEKIASRFKRMHKHYIDYKSGFKEAVKVRSLLAELKKDKIKPISLQAVELLNSVISNLEKNQNYQFAFAAGNLKDAFFQAEMNIRSFEISPDSLFIKETYSLIDTMQNNASELSIKIEDRSTNKKIDEFIRLLTDFRFEITKITNINRVYLHLVNVVLAGKAAEISKLSSEIGVLVSQKSADITYDISTQIFQSAKYYALLSITAGILAMIGAWLIAISISKPVRSMAKTLSLLAKGEPDTTIPGLTRKDEVGEMAKAANEFKNMAVRLEQQTVELEEFSYRTSHDLRSPLVSSIALLKTAKKAFAEGNEQNGQVSLQLVQSSLEKLENLVKDILELTRTKNAQEEPQTIDINALINECVQQLSYLSDFNAIDMQYDLQFDQPLFTKKSRVKLVIENLISNSVKYYDNQKTHSYIKISTFYNNGTFNLVIEDNSLGIPKHQQNKIFLMFKRFHPKTAFGSGLGLYMIKKSAEILEGSIVYQDTGGGSKFTLTIPTQIPL